MEKFDNIVNKVFKKKKTNLPKTVYINNNNNCNNTVNNNNKCINKNKNNKNDFKKSNWISTTKYSLLTFVPKNLFEQFRKFTNLYFLGIMVLSWLDVSPLTPGPSTINLGIVLLINAIKEGYEDFRRYQSDKRTNSQICKVLEIKKNGENNNLISKYWKDLKEGDIVFIENGNCFPADLIILSSSGESSPGQCFIETSNLDGESNLKYKQSILEINDKLINSNNINNNNNNNNICNFKFNEKSIIECEGANLNLNKFDGSIQLFNENNENIENNEKLPLTIEQLLIRGTRLMNTNYIYGLVVYVGHETKYMLNTMSTPTKRSKLEKTMERILIYLFIVQLFLCLFSTLMGLYFDLNFHKGSWYLDIPTNFPMTTFTRFFTFLVLFSTMIPISLYVTIEVIRFLQVLSINKDKKMCFKIKNQIIQQNELSQQQQQQHTKEFEETFAEARTSNLNEELGQVEYIFSDKTGTLTKNEMVFKICSINGKIYGELPKDDCNIKSTTSINEIDDTVDKESKEEQQQSQQQQYEKLIDLSIKENLEFVIVLAICNTVLPTIVEEDHDFNNNFKINYSSSSPDETALVEAAYNLGIKLYSKTPNSITIYIGTTGEFKTFKILNIIEFTSDRKRMSIILHDQDLNQIILYSKGADSSILPLLDNNNNNNNNNNNIDNDNDDENEILKNSKESLKLFSSNGLRTLCITKRLLSDEYLEWNKLYKEASLSMIERDIKMELISKQIETKLTLLGVTAIEDKLQDNVSTTISTLIKAGIKIYILTGDKVETAITIGLSCSLLKDLQLLILNDYKSVDTLLLKLNYYIELIERESKLNEFGLIIDGNTLTVLLMLKECEDKFYKLSMLCKSIVCCRVTPFQKSEVVRIVKERSRDSITLAIGDGANDVSMIQKAHIGIGISSGKEGRQAVLASDFSIAQFEYLSRLLLVHGRFNYKRLSLVICYFFFKNLASCLLQFWFAINNQFSGTTYYDSINSMLFNLTFTSLPIIVVGVFDRDLKPQFLLKFPQLYKDCQLGKSFNHRVFWSWIILSMYCSAVIYTLSIFIIDDNYSNHRNGKIGGLRNQSSFAFTSLVFVINFRLIMVIKRWSFLTYLSFGITFGFFFLVQLIYNSIHIIFGYRGDYYHIFFQILNSPIFYNSLLIVLFKLFSKFIKYNSRNSKISIIK
ncbi:hypothetical protein ACTFIR_011631 [Dictyostelium discoideum]